MTISELFAKVQRLKPHAYTDADLLSWLTRMEGRIFADIILTHENPDDIDFEGYTAETDPDETTLIVREPHDDVYLYYLMSQIDLNNLEFDKYNNYAGQFNEAYRNFELFWHRNHRPVQRVLYWNI